MKTKFIRKKLTYTGAELCELWSYRHYGILGDSIVTFIGPAQVDECLVDLEDKRAGAIIYSPLMLHLIIEHFDITLTETIVRQRLLIAMIAEILRQYDKTVERRGDDLFIVDKKLSVSIATASLMSTLIHVGLNIETEGTPVPTAGLTAMKVNPEKLACDIMDKYKAECASMWKARRKVVGVGK